MISGFVLAKRAPEQMKNPARLLPREFCAGSLLLQPLIYQGRTLLFEDSAVNLLRPRAPLARSGARFALTLEKLSARCCCAWYEDAACPLSWQL